MPGAAGELPVNAGSVPAFLGVATPLPAAQSEAIDGMEELPSGVDASRGNAAGGGAPEVLDFAMQTQLQTNWCWAAIAVSVAAFYKSAAVSQCEIATRCLAMPCCLVPLPPPNANWAGNQTYSLDVPLGAHMAGEPQSGPLHFPVIQQQILAGRPVCCHINWGSGRADDGHFNAIIGFDASCEEVYVQDPDAQYGNGSYPYDEFCNRYNGGTWDVAYLTQ
jgi:hypothetical protein